MSSQCDPLTKSIAAASRTNIVDGELTMVVNVVIAAVEKHGNTSANSATVIDNVLHKLLDKVSGDATSSLEESADTSSKGRFPTSNMLPVLVRAASVDALNRVKDICSAASGVTALRASVTVDALCRGSSSQGCDDDSLSELHSTY